jgi:hypothetical protein
MTFEVPALVTIKSMFFWNVLLCSLVDEYNINASEEYSALMMELVYSSETLAPMARYTASHPGIPLS